VIFHVILVGWRLWLLTKPYLNNHVFSIIMLFGGAEAIDLRKASGFLSLRGGGSGNA
jgi:hypothetical protein